MHSVCPVPWWRHTGKTLETCTSEGTFLKACPVSSSSTRCTYTDLGSASKTYCVGALQSPTAISREQKLTMPDRVLSGVSGWGSSSVGPMLHHKSQHIEKDNRDWLFLCTGSVDSNQYRARVLIWMLYNHIYPPYFILLVGWMSF